MIFVSSSVFAMSEINDLAEDLSREYIQKTGQVLIKKRIAVLDFDNVTPMMKKHDIGATVGALLTGEMGSSTVFRLVERKSISKIMKEMELSMTGMVNQEQAVKAGELSGAELLLLGTVSETGETISITARIISTEKGEVIVAKTVKVQREEMIKTADEVYWSAFQSEYGISISLGMNPIITNDGSMGPMMSLNVGYKPLRYLRVGGGFVYGKIIEFRTDKYDMNASTTAQTGVETSAFTPFSIYISSREFSIQHNYHVNVAMIKLYVDGLYPVYRWLTLGARMEYWFGMGKMVNIEQEIHGFPVPVSFDADNSGTYVSPEYAEQRIVVNAAGSVVHVFNPGIIAEFLISKRISINLSLGYLIATTIKPDLFYTADDNRETGDIDASGIFPRYPYYNFARDQNDKRITANISGVNFSLSVGLHI
ncbi:MAG: hypothetical protein CVV44_09990 [Spirochaetae bacterium HGW-Spirochaetae-1]|jgi:TolB-like protein|nr:MAG: hypothetical protein CVV44_09990 [Spirochaetae bacterium HGW-Spirochaetae-1]